MTKLYVTTYVRPEGVGGEVLLHTTTQPERAMGFIEMGYPGSTASVVRGMLKVDTPVRALFDTPVKGGTLKFHIIDLEGLPNA